MVFLVVWEGSVQKSHSKHRLWLPVISSWTLNQLVHGAERADIWAVVEGRSILGVTKHIWLGFSFGSWPFCFSDEFSPTWFLKYVVSVNVCFIIHFPECLGCMLRCKTSPPGLILMPRGHLALSTVGFSSEREGCWHLLNAWVLLDVLWCAYSFLQSAMIWLRATVEVKAGTWQVQSYPG